MRANLNVSQIFRVRTRLHYTWWFALALITATVTTQFPEFYPFWERLLLGVGASLAFVAALIIRQLAVNLIASYRHIPLKSVTLFVFGGVPTIAREATIPILELLLAVAGLLSSLLILMLFYLAYLMLVIAGNVMVAGLIQWLTFISLMLFFFHFVPGLPLDVGRILRTVVWRATGNYALSTRITIWIGRITAILLIVGGVASLIITRQWFTGLALALLGWALYSAVRQINRQTAIQEALQNIKVQDIMPKECPVTTSQLTVGRLVQECILLTGQRQFVVVDDGKLQGLVTLQDLKSVPQKRWDATRLAEIMTPVSRLKTAHANQSAAELLERMDELGVSQMTLLDGDKVVGIISRDSLLNFHNTRTELRI